MGVYCAGNEKLGRDATVKVLAAEALVRPSHSHIDDAPQGQLAALESFLRVPNGRL
jgi:hypothetical protein